MLSSVEIPKLPNITRKLCLKVAKFQYKIRAVNYKLNNAISYIRRIIYILNLSLNR